MPTRPQKFKLSETQKQNLQKLKADLQASIDTPASEASLSEFKADLKTALSDRKLTQSEFKTLVSDVVDIVSSAGITAAEARTIFYDLQDIAQASRFPKTNDTLTGTTAQDFLWGGLGDDSLNGAGSDDAGANEIDYLIGGGGRDTFVLGDAAQAFYDDGQAATLGLSDYALIVDFNLQQDKIQLQGTAADYTLAALPAELGITGTGIYKASSNALSLPELVGVVAGVTLTDLNTGFTFV